MPRSAELILPTIKEDGDTVVILDQTRLPHEVVFHRLNNLADAAEAIRFMRVRGAPLIGVTAAYGLALALRQGYSLEQAVAILAATRPTAVNLGWALGRMSTVLAGISGAERATAAWLEARAIANEDATANAAIGQHGLSILDKLSELPLRIMTHCNAGRLATVDHGTALAPVYAAQKAGIPVTVWVSETRPRNQGHLTAWELAEAGIPYTMIADNAAGLLLMNGKVDLIIVGADRIAANGDTVNKIGTYLKALAAQAHAIPFYVAAPTSTIDFNCADGQQIPIEERAGEELSAGSSLVFNPGFDITPASLITGIITERGIYRANGLAPLKP